MKRFFILFAVFTLLTVTALAQQTTYVFPGAGFRYTQADGETVLTRTNLSQNSTFIEELGTTEEAMLASFLSTGIIMEVYPASGGQTSISVTDASSITDAAEMENVDRESFLAAFEDSELYETCAYSELPEYLRLTGSAMYASIPVWSLRYVTVHLSQLYTFTSTIIGREPELEDDEYIMKVISGVKYLSGMTETQPTPTPVPEVKETPEPEETPAMSSIDVTSGDMNIQEIPSVTTESSVTIAGSCEPGVRVSVTGGAGLASAVSASDGTFSVVVQLEKGENVLQIQAGENVAEARIRYDAPGSRMEITEPTEKIFYTDNVMIRGITEPNVTVYVSDGRMNTNTRSNRNGAFSVRVTMDTEGEHTFTVTAKGKGINGAEAQITLTRLLTERERIAAFRASVASVTYAQLSSNVSSYAGKNFIFRGKVMDFQDYDGKPCALICVTNPQRGVWIDPLFVVLSLEDEVNVDDVLTFYLIGEDVTLPAAGTYTSDGQETEAPVARAFYVTANR